MKKRWFRSACLILALTTLFLSCKHDPEEIMPPPGNGNGGNGDCDTTNITFNGSVVPIFEQYCTFCHGGQVPEAGIDLTDWEDIAAVSQSGQLVGSINHIPGFSPMPKNGDKLSICEIRTIEIWLNDTTFTTPGNPCDPDTVYFEKDLLPILLSNCAKPGCHDEVSQQDGVRLTDYSSVLTTADVRPFDPEGSDLYEVIVEDDPDKRMPPPPNASLSQEQINLVNKWILQGAQNLFCDEEPCDTMNVTYSNIITGILNQHCLGCHNNSNPLGGLTLEGYDNVVAVANDGLLLGAVRHEPGYSPMPKNGNKLSDCKIRQIEIWIENGTPNL